eukprot:495420-Prorocentrum_minimum.AAC.1
MYVELTSPVDHLTRRSLAVWVRDLTFRCVPDGVPAAGADGPLRGGGGAGGGGGVRSGRLRLAELDQKQGAAHRDPPGKVERPRAPLQ